MGKTKFAVMLVFVLALAGGVVAGLLVSRLPSTGTVQASPRSPLAEELGLTADQNEKMREIWEDVRTKVDDCFLRAVESQKKRDEALFALLTDQQKVKFATMQQDCASEIAALKKERDAAFQEAVKRTEQLLSEPQRQRYREILRNRLGDAHPADAGDWLSPPTSMRVR